MIFQWELDANFRHDDDLVGYESKEAMHDRDNGITIAFVRYRPEEKRYACMFMPMQDNVYPDGQTFKNRKDARAFCKRHAPAMWIMYKSGNRS